MLHVHDDDDESLREIKIIAYKMKTSHVTIIGAILTILVISYVLWKSKKEEEEGFFADFLRWKNRDELARAVNAHIRSIIPNVSQGEKIPVKIGRGYHADGVYMVVTVASISSGQKESKEFATKGYTKARVSSLVKELKRLHGKNIYIDIIPEWKQSDVTVYRNRDDLAKAVNESLRSAHGERGTNRARVKVEQKRRNGEDYTSVTVSYNTKHMDVRSFEMKGSSLHVRVSLVQEFKRLHGAYADVKLFSLV